MATRKKPNLNKAIQKVKKASDSMYGDVDIDITELPCLNRPTKEKITANIDTDILEVMKQIASKHHTSYTSLMNDALRMVFLKKKANGGSV